MDSRDKWYLIIMLVLLFAVALLCAIGGVQLPTYPAMR